MTFETFEHKSDIGIRGIGKTKEKSFEESAKCLFNIQVDIKRIKPIKKIVVKSEAENQEELFVEFLNKLITMSTIKEMIFCKFHVKIKEDKKNKKLNLVSDAFGERLNPKKHNMGVEVKAATYSELRIHQDKKTKNWISQCIVDV